MVAYYNEKDPFAAEWLRRLIAANMIAPGDVDERSIEDVIPVELTKYTQCHFFAGIGGWSYAMRCAGWPDDRHGWSGSCPCQPFSQAGQGAGFADERHLWPAFFHLIEQCRPVVVFGEQVASPDGLAWLDLVQSDMEGTDYAFGALDQCAAGFGAPHIRQRLYWMAYDTNEQHDGSGHAGRRWGEFANGSAFSGVAYDSKSQRRWIANTERRVADWTPAGWQQSNSVTQHDSAINGLANNNNARLPQQQCDGRIPRGTLVALPRESTERVNGAVSWLGVADSARLQPGCETAATVGYWNPADTASLSDGQRGPTNGHWRNADWLRCKDDKWRPVEPGAFPLAHGVPNRVGLLRGYGNAINASQAQEFVKAAMEYAP